MGPATDGDLDLLREYARSGSGAAFARLWARYAAGVRAVCRRRLRDPAAVEDAVQQVFVTAARRAGSLPDHVVVAGWLRRTAVHQSSRDARAAATRRRHERQAAGSPTRPPASADAADMGVDALLGRLPPDDARAVALRYLGGRSLAEVGREMGTTDEAARKRVARGLDRLRRLFPAGPPAVLLTARDRWLRAKVVMAMTTAQKVAAVGAGLVLLAIGGGAVVLVTVAGRGAARPSAPGRAPVAAVAPPPATAVATQPANRDDWRAAIDRLYALRDGEVLRQVVSAIPQRQPFFEAVGGGPAFGSADDWWFTVAWDGHAAHWQAATRGERPLGAILKSSADVDPSDLDQETVPVELPIEGDIVYRSGSPVADRMAALGPIVSEAIGRPVHFERRTADVAFLTVTGHCRFAPSPDGGDANAVDLVGRPVDMPPPPAVEGRLRDVLNLVGGALHAQVDDRTGDGSRPVRYHNRIMAGSPDVGLRIGETDAPERLLANVAAQTGLTFTRGRRPTLAWCLVDGAAPTTRPAR